MLDGTKKKSTEPNLHVCGEDGTERVIYKLKEKHAKKREKKNNKKKKENLDKKRRAKREKELYQLSRKMIVTPALGLRYT